MFNPGNTVSNGEFIGVVVKPVELYCMGRRMYEVDWSNGVQVLACEGDLFLAERCHDCGTIVKTNECCVIDSKAFCHACCEYYVGEPPEGAVLQ